MLTHLHISVNNKMINDEMVRTNEPTNFKLSLGLQTVFQTNKGLRNKPCSNIYINLINVFMFFFMFFMFFGSGCGSEG